MPLRTLKRENKDKKSLLSRLKPKKVQHPRTISLQATGNVATTLLSLN
jgi:hypothetical protein